MEEGTASAVAREAIESRPSPSGRLGTSLTALAVLVFAVTAFAPPPAAAGVPRAFFGIVPQTSLGPQDFERMRGVVGTIRIPVHWPQVEPSPGSYEFAELDGTMTSAAAAGIRVLPFVYGTPSWLGPDPARPPLASRAAERAWTDLLRQLVRRYGPGGEIWRGQDVRLPVRRWQIWNEPNFRLFWRPRPSPRGYARLLRISAGAIRDEDPAAQIVAAGVAPVEGGMTPWSFLRKLYEVRGVRSDFDFVALHPYAPHVNWVAEEVRLVRRVMARAGDGRKPVLITEIGVASAGIYPSAFDKGRQGQASYMWRALRLLVAKRHEWGLGGVDWFTWRDSAVPDPHCAFCEFGGLFDAGNAPKPAWWAFKRAIAVAVR